MIEILIPTLGRPHRLEHVVNNIKSNTINENRVVFIVEPNDHASIEAASKTDSLVLINKNKACYAGAINTGYQETTGEWLFCGDDSLDFRYGWDKTALDTYGNYYQVIGVNDLNNPSSMSGTGSTIHLVARSYLDEVGGVVDGGPRSFLNEMYNHYWTDTEFIDTAKRRGKFIGCLNSHVQHLHWASGTAPVDSTTHKNESQIPSDQAIYVSRSHLWS